MLKIIIKPEESDFRLLKLIGTIAIFLGLAVFAFGLFSYVYDQFLQSGRGLRLSATGFFLVAWWVVPLVLVGHLMHWIVAIWESRSETNRLLVEINSSQQHSKSLNTDTGDAGAG